MLKQFNAWLKFQVIKFVLLTCPHVCTFCKHKDNNCYIEYYDTRWIEIARAFKSKLKYERAKKKKRK